MDTIQFLKKEWLNLSLNHREKIFFQVPGNDIVHCCYWARIMFVQDNHKILLTHWEIQDTIERFIKNLDLVIQNKLLLNFELHDEIGYAWNLLSYQKKAHDEYSDETFRKREELYSYLVFNGRDYATWMYNDDQGNIMLKITPLFPLGRTRNKMPKYNTFLHWMKTYKPIAIRIIPMHIAMQWLDQARQINHVIEHNIKEINSRRE